jgi:hypothetical protein
MEKLRFLSLLLVLSVWLGLAGCTPPSDNPDVNIDIKQPDDGPPSTTTTTTGGETGR